MSLQNATGVPGYVLGLWIFALIVAGGLSIMFKGAVQI